MKFNINRNSLKQSLDIANKLIPSASANPCMVNFFIKVSNEGLEIRSTDGNISCKLLISVKDEKENEIIKDIEDGEFLVSAKYLIDILSKLDSEFVNFKMVDSNCLSIYDASSNFNLMTIDTSEYPDLNFNIADQNKSFHIKSSQLKLLYDRTSFAVATKGSKDMFYGINIRAKEGKLYFLTTDSFRMARYAIPNKDETGEFSFTCPLKALNMVSSLIKDEEVEIIFDEMRALFKTNNMTISTSLYVGEFPSPERLIPSAFPYSISFKTDLFLKSISRVGILAALEGKQPACKCSISRETGVTLSSSSAGNGDSKDNLTFCSYTLPESEDFFEIGFNTEHVQQALRAINSEEASIVFSSPNRVLMVKNDDPENIQILTPIRMATA